jgi:hypothetical protein
MNMIIGTREMIRIRPDGSKSTIVLEIGKPEPLLEGDKRGKWFSTSRITGISENPKTTYHYSQSSLDALVFALAFQGLFLSGLPYAHEIEYAMGHNFLLPVVPIPSVLARVSENAERIIPQAIEYHQKHQ